MSTIRNEKLLDKLHDKNKNEDYKLDNLKLVKVEWLAAMSDDNTWQELSELAKQVLRPVTCVGWILSENKDNIILISSFDTESQCGGGGCTIPKNCITKLTKLEEVNSG